MAGVERTSAAQLSAGERAELEALLADSRQGRAGERFLSDFADAAGWWLLLFLAALVGGIASGLVFFEDGSVGVADFLRALVVNPMVIVLAPHIPGLLVSAAVIVWVALSFVRSYGRRGYAITSFALIRVRGPRLRLLRHLDVARAERSVHGSRGKRFTALDLTAKDGSRVCFYVTGNFARAALDEVERARSAAGLPPL
jgi:hypothetical protein